MRNMSMTHTITMTHSVSMASIVAVYRCPFAALLTTVLSTLTCKSSSLKSQGRNSRSGDVPKLYLRVVCVCVCVWMIIGSQNGEQGEQGEQGRQGRQGHEGDIPDRGLVGQVRLETPRGPVGGSVPPVIHYPLAERDRA